MELKKCICKISIDNKINGLGFFLKLIKGKDFFYFLISCEHIITKNFIKDKKNQKLFIIILMKITKKLIFF